VSTKKLHKLADVFADVATHKIVANIIITHSTNKSDIREIALEGLDMKSGRKILDLGCGFGYFTRALKGKADPEALVTGIDCFKEYEHLYIESCKISGLKGKFISSGKSILSEFDNNCFDTILCSYALYFSPDNVDKELINIIINQLRKDTQTKKRLKITKDDIIFVCSQPLKK